MIKSTLLILALLPLAGCAPLIDAELGLVEQSRRGVALAKDSLGARRETVASILKKDRLALDEAFDQDARQRDSIDAAWVIEARKAYALALDAFARRDQSVAQAFDADLDNLLAIDEALAQLERLNLQQNILFRDPR